MSGTIIKTWVPSIRGRHAQKTEKGEKRGMARKLLIFFPVT